jgi:hypothetical protein
MDNEVVVMAVTRVPPMGKLVVDALGKRYESINNVTDESVRRMLNAAIAELVVFAGGYDKLVHAGLAPPIAGDPAVPPSIEERQAKFSSAVEQQKDEILIAPDVITSPPKKIDEPISIPDQINPIIEKHLASDPELATHSAKLEQDHQGNLSVICDGKIYERPDMIEDARIRKAIRAALSEWDRT